MKRWLEKAESVLFYTFLFFLPIRFGKHFWPDFTLVSGVRIDYLSPTIYATDILLICLYVLWFIRLFKTKNIFSIFLGRQALGFYLFFLLFTILVSGNLLNGAYHFIKFVEFLLLFLYIVDQKWPVKKLELTGLVVGASCLFQSTLAVSQFFNHGSFGGLLYFFGERTFTSATPGIANASIFGELILRPYATFSHPNVLAGFLFFAMLFCLLVISGKTNPKIKAFFIGVILLGTIALLLTLSRVGIILWGVILVGYGIRKAIKLKASRRMMLVGFIGLFSLGAMVFLTMGGLVFGRIFGSSMIEESVVIREVLTRSSLAMLFQNPFWGMGLGNFLPSLPSFQNQITSYAYLQPVHNIFLLTAAETGIIGLAFLLHFLYKTYQRLLVFRKDKVNGFYYEGLIILLTGVLLFGQFDHYLFTLQQGQLLFAVLLGFCWASMNKNSSGK